MLRLPKFVQILSFIQTSSPSAVTSGFQPITNHADKQVTLFSGKTAARVFFTI